MLTVLGLRQHAREVVRANLRCIHSDCLRMLGHRQRQHRRLALVTVPDPHVFHFEWHELCWFLPIPSHPQLCKRKQIQNGIRNETLINNDYAEIYIQWANFRWYKIFFYSSLPQNRQATLMHLTRRLTRRIINSLAWVFSLHFFAVCCFYFQSDEQKFARLKLFIYNECMLWNYMQKHYNVCSLSAFCFLF